MSDGEHRTIFFLRLLIFGRRSEPRPVDYRDSGYHTPSTFLLNGRRWRCTWERHASSLSDLADWDDGIWPTFEVATGRTFLGRTRWTAVHNARQWEGLTG